jgi:tRNA A37 methylthiotransferase MiaB
MGKLKIYLGDMTYDTITLSTETFPLNIGFIASFCKKKYGDNIEITLFKYINELEEAIINSPPDILGMSNYVWCQNISLELFKIFKERNSSGITIWGGPNFPLDLESQEKFLKKHDIVDIYIPVEGETGFANVVEQCIKLDNNNLRQILSNSIEGCIVRNPKNELKYKESIQRISNLDEIPSPYLTGLMDKFFDGRLSPMLQTNRGCPYMCSYCVDGTNLVRKVNKFGSQRTKEEIEYIGKHIPKNIHNMYISDLNFGMIPDDIKTCQYIKNIQKKYDFPHFIEASTGKNSKEKIINAIKELNGSLQMLMSVQSMDQTVLKNIRRDNISLDQMMGLIPAIKEVGLSTVSECILGLPGETFQSHVDTLRNLVKAKIDNIQVFTCMMLPGSELATPQERKKWNLETRYRILPRDFTQLKNKKIILETEECVISSDSLSFDEYVELRLLAFILWTTNVQVAYDSIKKLFSELKLDIFELFFQILKTNNTAPPGVQEVMNSYREATKNELWDSPEEIMEYFQKESEYEKLLNEEAGINVIQFHHAMVMSKYFEEWTENVILVAENLIKSKINFDEILEVKFQNIANYCRGLTFNILGKDRKNVKAEYEFGYNISKWLKNSKLELNDVKFQHPTKIKFEISDEQYKIVQNEIDRYGESFTGISKATRHLQFQFFLRKPSL